MNIRKLSLLAASALVFATGCPTENNDKNPPPIKDMSSQDMTPDSSDMPVEDMKPDQSQAQVGCDFVKMSPKTQPLSAQSASITWTLLCDQNITSANVTFESSSSPEIQSTGVTCEAQGEQFECTVVSQNHVPPQKEGKPIAGADPLSMTIALSDGVDPSTISSSFHWYLEHEEMVKAYEAGPQSNQVALPKGFGSHGLGLQVKKTASGPVAFAVMFDDKGEGVQLSQFNALPIDRWTHVAITHTNKSLKVFRSDVVAQQLHTVRMADNRIDALWWGYDATNNDFVGTALMVDAQGAVLKERALKAGQYNGPKITQIIDVMSGISGDTTSGSNGGVLLMAKTERDTIAAIQLFEGPSGDQLKLVGEFDQLMQIPSTQWHSENSGFALGLDNQFNLSNTTLFWHSRPNATNDGVVLTVTTTSSRSPLSLEIPTGFADAEVFYSRPEKDVSVVLIHGPDGQRQLYRITDADFGAGKVPKSLPLPNDVDIRPDINVPEGGSMEAQLKASGIWFGSRTLPVIAENNQLSMLGRWPWNWRELKEKRKQQQANKLTQAAALGRWPWDWRERKQRRAVSMNVRYDNVNADASLFTSPDVSQDVSTKTDSSLEFSYAPYDPNSKAIAIGLTDDGAAMTLHSLQSPEKACQKPQSCLVSVGPTDKKYQVYIGPGKDGPTMAVGKYGDIMIDGVELEWKMPAPPTIVHAGKDKWFIIAPIERSDGATHAVWSIDANDNIEGPGFMELQAGESDEVNLTYQSKPIISSVATDEDATTQRKATIALTFGDITAKNSDDLFEYTIAVGVDALSAAIKTPDNVKKVDTSKQLVLSRKRAKHMRTWSMVLRAESNDGALGTTAQSLPSLAFKELVASNAEQVDMPLVWSYADTMTCPTLTLSAMSGLGTTNPLMMMDLWSSMPMGERCDGVEYIIGSGDFLGDGTNQVFTMQWTGAADFTGKIKRITLKKRKLHWASVAQNDTGVIVTAINSPMTSALPAPPTTVFDDVNGDGLDDLIVNTGRFKDSKGREATQAVFYSDGLGGFSEPYAKPAGFGRGTKKSTMTTSQQLPQLQ